jgi:hypothetical protein
MGRRYRPTAITQQIAERPTLIPTNGRARHLTQPGQDTHATKWPPEPGSRKQVFVCGVAERGEPVRQDTPCQALNHRIPLPDKHKPHVL